jgi:acetyltransferase-like isoleucine patch superfamily enzyme
MKKIIIYKTAFIVLLLLVSPCINAQVAEQESSSNVTMNVNDVSVKAALLELSNKAGWNLIYKADEKELQKTITVILTKPMPPEDILPLLLAEGKLKYSFAKNTLIIENDHIDEDAGNTITDLSQKVKNKFYNREERKKAKRKGSQRIQLGNEVIIEQEEEVSKSVSIGNSVTIKGTVEDSAVSIGGDVFLESTAVVGGDAVSIGGKIIAQDGAIIQGDAVSIGKGLFIEEGATVEGDRVSFKLPLSSLSGVGSIFGMGIIFWIFAAIVRSLVLYILALLLVWGMPDRITKAKEYFDHKAGWSFGSGFLLMICFFPLILILALTIIGIPLIPIVALLLAGAIVFGYATVFTWLGSKVPILKSKKSSTWALTIGFLAFTLINMIPILGGIFFAIMTLAAVGVSFLSRFGSKAA